MRRDCFFLRDRSAIVIVNVLIFVLIFTMIATMILSITFSQIRTLENNIQRAKGFYANEAGFVFVYETIWNNQTIPASITVDWIYNSAGAVVTSKTVGLSAIPPIINSTVAISPSW